MAPMRDKGHWAAAYIGVPWKPGADGPDAFDCWNLVRRVCQQRFGFVMPPIHLGDLGESANVTAIKQAAQESGFRRFDGEPEADDIVLMRGIDGLRHVGIMVQTARGLRLLHCNGHMTDHGPVGNVVAQPFKDVRGEVTDIELWRRA